MTTCANHPEANALARCTRCRTPFCDGCVAFLVNDDPWCEPCGNAMIESGRGRPVLAAVVFTALVAAFVLVICFQIFVIGRIYLYSAAFGMVPFIVAWRIAVPPTSGDRPTIIDRNTTRPRPPVPVNKRLG